MTFNPIFFSVQSRDVIDNTLTKGTSVPCTVEGCLHKNWKAQGAETEGSQVQKTE